MPVTKVIFRLISDQVIALFPEIPAAHSHAECLYYFNGQYGTCNFRRTVHHSLICSADEYVSVYQQLINLKYNLLVTRWTQENESILSKERHQRYTSVYSYV